MGLVEEDSLHRRLLAACPPVERTLFRRARLSGIVASSDWYRSPLAVMSTVKVGDPLLRCTVLSDGGSHPAWDSDTHPPVGPQPREFNLLDVTLGPSGLGSRRGCSERQRPAGGARVGRSYRR